MNSFLWAAAFLQEERVSFAPRWGGGGGYLYVGRSRRLPTEVPSRAALVTVGRSVAGGFQATDPHAAPDHAARLTGGKVTALAGPPSRHPVSQLARAGLALAPPSPVPPPPPARAHLPNTRAPKIKTTSETSSASSPPHQKRNPSVLLLHRGRFRRPYRQFYCRRPPTRRARVADAHWVRRATKLRIPPCPEVTTTPPEGRRNPRRQHQSHLFSIIGTGGQSPFGGLFSFYRVFAAVRAD